jgi:hypothetical protein
MTLTLQPQSAEKLITIDAEVQGDIGQDRRQRADSQGAVAGYGEVVLTFGGGRQPEVAPCLVIAAVAERGQRPDELIAREIPQERHAAGPSCVTR